MKKLFVTMILVVREEMFIHELQNCVKVFGKIKLKKWKVCLNMQLPENGIAY
jgi:hypothetical protein